MPTEKDKIFQVEAQEDFVEKLTVASNAGALSELIWNGLDAEATKVSVEVDYSSLGLARIRVRDDGHGIAPEDAEALFMHLGGSWKRTSKKSKNGIRVLHGEEGKGRFRALALGRVAEWLITARNAAGQLVRYKITVIKDSARQFRVGPVTVLKDDVKTGVEVTISEPYKQTKLDTPSTIQELNETRALYLREYPGVKITFLGTTLDPKKIIEFERVFTLPPIPDGAQKSHTAVLKAHLKTAGLKVVVNEPVNRIDGKKGIVDLMLSRKVPTNREDELSHLVVELKAPTVIATSKETEQIEKYAFTVQEDQRFRNVPTRWSFWLVVNDMDKYTANKTHQKEKPDGLLWESGDPHLPSRIWVKTWSQIIHDCKTRLHIFQQALNLSADKDIGLNYLRKTYERVLLGVDAAPETDEEEVADEITAVPEKVSVKVPSKK